MFKKLFIISKLFKILKFTFIRYRDDKATMLCIHAINKRQPCSGSRDVWYNKMGNSWMAYAIKWSLQHLLVSNFLEYWQFKTRRF